MGEVCLWAAVVAFKVLGTLLPQLLPKWPSQHNCSAASPLPAPWILAGASVPISALRCWPKLARQVLAWVLSRRGDSCGLRSPSASWGQCGLVSAPRAGSLHRGVMCTSFVSLPALFVAGGYLFFFGLCGRAACTAQVGKPPLCGHPRLPFAPAVFVRRLPGPALSAARVVCARWVCLQRHSRFLSLFGVTVREKYSFLCSLPSKSLLCLIFQDFAAPLWARL